MGYEINQLREINEILKNQNFDMQEEMFRIKNDRAGLEHTVHQQQLMIENLENSLD